MKSFRACFICLLVVLGVGILSGCATTGQDSSSAKNDMSWGEKKQPSATEDMNWIEKTGYYLGWLALDVLYGTAANNQSLPP